MFDQKYKEELESKLSTSQKAKFNFLIAKNIWNEDAFDDLVLLDNNVIYRHTISSLISSINNIISYGIFDKLLEKNLSKEIDDCVEKITSNFKLNNLFIFSNEQISSA
jgi:DNA replication protein DnaD